MNDIATKVTFEANSHTINFLSPWEGMTTLPGDEKARGDVT
jgi:hypothetical protein